MVLWSVIRCSFTDPGIATNFIYVNIYTHNIQSVKNELETPELKENEKSLLVFAKEPLLAKYSLLDNLDEESQKPLQTIIVNT